VNIKELKEVAEKATPGEWSLNKYGEPVDATGENIRAKGIALTNAEDAKANTAYIALANPSTILSLIARVEQMEAALRKASQLASIACDWHLEEVEIDGEMVDTHDLRDEFDAALETPANPIEEVVDDQPGTR
jgi:hypothetical protein